MSFNIPQSMFTVGPMKPPRFEAEIKECLVVKGEIPKSINGGFYRCGPAWKRPQKQGCAGWLSQDGMVTALLLEDGKATFRNKWVRTPKYIAEEQHGESLFEYADGGPDWWCYGVIDPKPDPRAEGLPGGGPWVHAVPFGDNILSLGELNTVPYVIDPITLETKGWVSWAESCGEGLVDPIHPAARTFCPHPKWDVKTGEMFGWSATDREPFARIIVAKPDGSVKTRDLDMGSGLWAANLHDGWLTEDYLVLGFQPFINSRERAREGKPVLGWDDNGKYKLVLVPRSLEGDIRYIDAPQLSKGYNHTAGANTIDNKLYLDAPLYDVLPFPFEQFLRDDGSFSVEPLSTTHFGRWVVNLDTETVEQEILSERLVEEPKIDERYFGRNYNYTFLMSGPSYLAFDTVVKRNVLTGEEDLYTHKHDLPFTMLEGTFVPRSDTAPEADGYFIVPVSRYAENMSNYLIFDTSAISQGPIAEIELPLQIGWAPHGSFRAFD